MAESIPPDLLELLKYIAILGIGAIVRLVEKGIDRRRFNRQLERDRPFTDKK